jgi:hypothetical protein
VVTIYSYRVLIAATVPILALSFASFGRAGATARDPIDLSSARRTTGSLDPRVRVPDVRLASERPPRTTPEPLSFRNPFEFAPRRLPSTSPPSSAVLAPPAQVPPAIPPSVVLSLIGVAATTHGDGRVERTAIITGPADALYLVRDGDVVMTRYRVDDVLAGSVRLFDSATGASVSLVIR